MNHIESNFTHGLGLEPLQSLQSQTTSLRLNDFSFVQQVQLIIEEPSEERESNKKENVGHLKLKHQFGAGGSITVDFNQDQYETGSDGATFGLLMPPPTGLPLSECHLGQSIMGTAGADLLNGTSANDSIFGQSGDDMILGGDCDDQLFGEAGNDNLEGNAGNDQLSGGSGIDQLKGGPGMDTLFGGDNLDQLFGGLNGDSLLGGHGNDFLFGQDRDDTLLGEEGNDILDGGSGNDSLNGGINDDILLGGGDFDTLIGETGDDTLKGEDGNDILEGGSGDDLLIGSIGGLSINEVDTLEGGSGFDIFALAQSNAARNLYSSSGNDDYAVITDFEVGIDTIQLQSPTLGVTSYSLFQSGQDTLIHLFTADDSLGPWEPGGLLGGSYDYLGIVKGVTGLSLNRDFSWV